MRTMVFASLLLVACGSSNSSPEPTGPADAGVDVAVAVDAAVDAAVPPTGAPPSCTGTPGGGANPQPRGEFAGALDATGTKLVIFGGDEGTAACPNFPTPQYAGDTWLLDVGCASWQKLAASGPQARSRFAMASDPNANRALLFGGRAAGSGGADQLFNDVWSFDFTASTWSQVSTGGTPPVARSNTAAVFDAKGNQLVVFGGNTATSELSLNPLSDTFALDLASGTWRAIAKAGAPPARLFHAMAIDDDARVAYVFGGGDQNAFSGSFLTDVWALDLAKETWSEVTTGGTAPNGRIDHGMMFDTQAKHLVTFAGHDDGNIGNENDLYVLDVTTSPATWSRLPMGDTYNKAPTGACTFPPDFTIIDKSSPERRSAFAMAARSDGLAFVVFAGECDCGLLDDVWWWADDSRHWTTIVSSPVGQSCLRVQTQCKGLCG